MAPCRSCEAPIRWAISAATRRPIPLDFEPVANGKHVLKRDGTGGEVACFATDEDKKLHRPLYDSHFATCPDAGGWRNSSR